MFTCIHQVVHWEDGRMSARSVFADLLAAYRKEAGWTQAEAAQRFTMSSSLYRKIESCDRKPRGTPPKKR